MDSSDAANHLNQIPTSKTTQEYFRSEAGLKELKLAWNTALFLLRKEDLAFQSMQSEYLLLLESGTIIDVSFFDYGHESFEGYEAPKIKVRLTIALKRDLSASKSSVKQSAGRPLSMPESSFARLGPETKELLAEIAWQEIKGLKIWDQDEQITSREEHENYGDLVEATFWNWDRTGPSASFAFEIVYASESSEVLGITGRPTEKVFELLQSYRLPSTSKSRSENGASLDHTLCGLEVGRLQRDLGNQLLSRGLLVIAEPGVLIPNNSFSGHRRPDLIALYKGRALAIEIDSSYHLIDRRVVRVSAERLLAKLDKNPSGLSREEVEKMFLDTAFKKKKSDRSPA